jgi:hypothetical protein
MSLSPPTIAKLAAIAAALMAGAGCSPPERGIEVDVYVAGWESNETVQIAKLWMNGAAVALSDGTHGALAIAMAVSGGDVYVAGGVNAGGVDVATYWKNGVAVSLTDGTSQAFAEAIVVSGSDVYVAGYESSGARGASVATYWKNGAPVVLTSGAYPANALAIAVSEGDVYVAGYELEATEVAPGSTVVASVAKIWRNGVPIPLADGGHPSAARSIVVDGPDVYAAGDEAAGANGVAKVWKNGIPVALSDGIYGAVAKAVALSGSDVLVAGCQHDGNVDVARIWRNGVPVDLTYASSTGVEAQGFAGAIAVRGTDVYAAGHHGSRAMYWKNGAQVALTDGRFRADARAIAIVGR